MRPSMISHDYDLRQQKEHYWSFSDLVKDKGQYYYGSISFVLRLKSVIMAIYGSVPEL